MAMAQGVCPHQPHPLAQLSEREVAAVASACKSYASAHAVPAIRFNTVQLREPPKKALLAFERNAGPRPERIGEAILIVPAANRVIEALVRLTYNGPATPETAEVTSWVTLDGVHPVTTPDDNAEAEAVVKACPRIAQLLAERYGVTNIADELICDTWACHNAPAHLNHRRLMQGFLYLKLAGKYDNEYAHPLDMVPIVDLNLGKVVHIDMYDKPVAVPRALHNYNAALMTGPWREGLKPLHVLQPEGASFALEDGGVLSWQRWRMRIGFNGREGVVLHNVSYDDPAVGRRRPVLHRASLVEMAVPYGDPHMPYIRKCAFDVGDYGFGLCANSLELGCDCLGHIRYLDAIVNNAKGEPVVIKKAVCIHEEDSGIMWKHWDCRTNHAEVRRARRLVVSMVSTFQNYEYALYWYFYVDGSIHFELKLTGILSTSSAAEEEVDTPFGVRVAPGVNATAHQHFFCMRLDPAIDDDAGGKDLVVSEVEAVSLPRGPANPAANGFRLVETELLNTTQAQRVHNFATARFWAIKNPFSINPVTKRPVSYRLLPAASPTIMALPESLVCARAVFASKQLWVTPHADDQRYPAGEHVVQSERCLGLAEWTKREKQLLGNDPVIWYSFGVTHAPRIEDYPVMPVEVCGFVMKPDGFFTANPALDLPPTRDPRSVEDGACAASSSSSSGGGGGACCAAPAAAPAAAGGTAWSAASKL